MIYREYNFTPINGVIEYWQRYWRHRVMEIKNANNFGSRIFTPRFLLESIVFEIENSTKINPLLSKSFKDELGKWNKQQIFNSLFGIDCSLALKHWDKPVWVATLCKSILNKMNEGLYYDAVIKALIVKLHNPASLDVDNDRKYIHIYSDILIGEFIAKDYCLEDIEDMLHHPDLMMAETFEVIGTFADCICGIDLVDYSSRDEYEHALTAHFQRQSIDDKVHILDLHYNRETSDAIVIVRLIGIEGQIDITFDDIHLYSITKNCSKRYLSSESTNWIECNDTDHLFINAAIPVKCRGYYSAINEAVKRLCKILAPIQIWLGAEKPISYFDKNITIIENGDERFTSLPISRTNKSENQKGEDAYVYVNVNHDITNAINKVQKLSDRIQQIKNLSKAECDRLYKASKWIQNAQNASTASDRLLYSWFAIESLIKLSCDYEQSLCPKDKIGILDLLQNILTPLIVRNRFYHQRDLILDELYKNIHLYNNRYKVPDYINARLVNPNGIEYSEFFHWVTDLQKTVINEDFHDKLCQLKDFYHKSCSGLKEFRNSVNNEIIYIYCLRNHIVHNGNIIERQITYYSQRALHYTSSLFNAILSVTASNNLTIQDAIIKICADCEIFEVESKTLLKQYNLS